MMGLGGIGTFRVRPMYHHSNFNTVPTRLFIAQAPIPFHKQQQVVNNWNVVVVDKFGETDHLVGHLPLRDQRCYDVRPAALAIESPRTESLAVAAPSLSSPQWRHIMPAMST